MFDVTRSSRLRKVAPDPPATACLQARTSELEDHRLDDSGIWGTIPVAGDLSRVVSHSMEIEYHCYPPGLQIQLYRRKIALQVANPDSLVLRCGYCLRLDDEARYQVANLLRKSLQDEGYLPREAELAQLILQSRDISMNRISCGEHSLSHGAEGLFG